MLEKCSKNGGFWGGLKPLPRRGIKTTILHVKGKANESRDGYFWFGRHRETERVVSSRMRRDRMVLQCFLCITKGMLDKREP